MSKLAFRILALLIFALTTSQLAYAAAKRGNRLCAEARLSSFVVSGANGAAPLVNYCLKDESQLPAKVSKALTAFLRIHRRTAALFNLSVRELLPGKVAVVLQGEKLGPAASFYSAGTIVLGTFREWPRGDIERAVYTHELGHALSESVNSKLGAFSALTREILLLETAADDLALTLFGRLFLLKEQLPGCLSEIRHIDSQSSFNQPIGEFDRYASLRKLNSCCDSFETSAQQTVYGRRLCAEVRHKIQLSPLRPYISTPFDPTQVTLARAMSGLTTIPDDAVIYDPHQLGIPITSFLSELRDAYRVGGSLLVDFLSKANAVTYGINFTCTVDALPGDTKMQTHYRAGKVLQALRERFAPIDGGVIFDQLWTAHALDVGVQFDENLIFAQAGVDSESEFLRDIQGLGSDNETPEQRQCFDEFDSGMISSTFCRVSCV